MRHPRLSLYLLLSIGLVGCTSMPSTPAYDSGPAASSLSSSVRGIPYNRTLENRASVPSGEVMTDSDELPFLYAAGPLDLTLYRITEPATPLFKYLTANSTDTSCAPNRPAGYFETLKETFSTATQTIYTFRVRSGQYEGSEFHLVLIQNRLPYRTVEDVQADFYACDVGALHAFHVSPEWLLFDYSCGDKGCERNREQLKPTVTLRSGVRRKAENEALGIKFTYPVTWGIAERSGSGEIIFETGYCPECLESIEVEPADGRQAADAVAALDPIIVESVRERTVAGLPALEVQTTEFALIHIYFVHGTRLFTLYTDGYMDREGVLDSLQFLE